MRKAQKQEIQDCLDSLQQSHKEIIGALKKGYKAQVQNMLSQCQEFAVSLGEIIERFEGEGHITVTYLEEYCEGLFRIYEEINGSRVDESKINELLMQLLARIEDSTRNDIPVRKEVVFLPYKASMWDSMESVWMAADEDESCDAYVVAIPYYDKNPDGSLGQMHYEGNEYPDYVPVTDWQAYNLEERRPDMIFFQNPYDNLNYITCVHPRYFTKDLKKCTDMLVYLPYFVGIGDHVEEQFCVVPGVANADRVIVESEAVKKIYIESIRKHEKEHNCAGFFGNPEEKILPLGSPKLDRIRRVIDSGSVNIPEEWKSKIYRADGQKKKIIFYNTTVVTWLNHTDTYMDKVRSVLDTFQRQKDAVLLWRPHPLLATTMKLIRMDLYQEYMEVVGSFKEENWGIYDESADLDRALVLSDAYYGDMSSVVELYKVTGKPIMIQNVYSLPENNYSLAMDNIVEYEGEWWFLALKDNGIYKMNKETLTATLITRIPYNANYFGEHPQYGKIHIYKRKIFVIPMLGDFIAVYNMDKDAIHYINYGRSNPSRGTVFAEKVEYKKKLYLIPCGYDYIVSIDLETEEIRDIAIEKEIIVKNHKDAYAWGSVFQNENKIFFTKISDDKIVCFDFESEETTIYKCELLKNGGAGICGNEKYIWIIPRKTDQILRWSREKKELKIFDQFPDGYRAGEWSFHKVWLDDELYLLPRDANMCIAVNLENGKMRNLGLDRNVERANGFLNRYIPYSNIWKNEDKVQVISTQRGTLFSCGDGRKIYKEAIVISQKHSDVIVWQNIKYEWQNRFENIESYIDADLQCECGNTKGENVGKRIYELNKS